MIAGLMPLERRRKAFLTGVEPVKEYRLQKLVSYYMNLYYKNSEYRVDLAGSNLSKAQAGKMNAVNKRRAWHDFEVYDPHCGFYGLCVELKTAGTKLIREKDARTKIIVGYKSVGRQQMPVYEGKLRRAGDWWDNHIEEQAGNIAKMRALNRAASFAVGLKHTLELIDAYMNDDLDSLSNNVLPKIQLL